MKHVVLLLGLLSNVIICSAINISSFITLRDGRIVSNEHVFFAQDDCTFSIEQEGKKADWEVLVYALDDWTFEKSFVKVLDSTEASHCFSIKIDNIDWARIVPDNRWIDPEQFMYPNDNSIYFKAIVNIKENGILMDSMELTFNLAPSKPIIANINFDYIFDWEADVICPDGILTADLISQRADDYLIRYSQQCLFELLDDNTGFPFPLCEIIEAGENDTTKFVYDWVDWGSYVAFDARNKYGSAISDTICSTDYITDPAVLARLEEIRLGRTGINEAFIRNFPLKFDIKENVLSLKGDVSSFSEISIYDISGRMLIFVDNAQNVDISQLVNGFYILSCVDDKKRKHTVKFRK